MPTLYLESKMDILSMTESGLATYTYSKTQTLASFFSLFSSYFIELMPSLEIVMISPGSKSLIVSQPIASRAQDSEEI